MHDSSTKASWSNVNFPRLAFQLWFSPYLERHLPFASVRFIRIEPEGYQHTQWTNTKPDKTVVVAFEHSRVLTIFCSKFFTSDHPLYNVHIVYSQYMGGLKWKPCYKRSRVLASARVPPLVARCYCHLWWYFKAFVIYLVCVKLCKVKWIIPLFAKFLSFCTCPAFPKCQGSRLQKANSHSFAIS